MNLLPCFHNTASRCRYTKHILCNFNIFVSLKKYDLKITQENNIRN